MNEHISAPIFKKNKQTHSPFTKHAVVSSVNKNTEFEDKLTGN